MGAKTQKDNIMETVDSLHEFIKIISPIYYAEPRGHWVFRGHSDVKHELIPSVGRCNSYSNTRDSYEKSMFKIFCREVQGITNIIPANEWDWLSLAQHHGLPTRLLDWSHNLLVAIYFAVESNPDSDGMLFALRALINAAKQDQVREGSPFEITMPVKFYPNIVSPRIRAQEGLFVACSDVEKPLDQALRESWRIDKYYIPAKRKAELRYDLYRLGVHASSLFPDMDGLAARIRWQHSIDPPRRD